LPEESEHSYCSVGLIEPSTVPPKPSQSLTTAYTEVPLRTANTQPKARPYQLRGRTVPNQARCGRPKCPGRQTRLYSATRFDFGQLRRTPNPRSAPFAGSTILCRKPGLQSAYPAPIDLTLNPVSPSSPRRATLPMRFCRRLLRPISAHRSVCGPMTATRVGTEPAFAVSGARHSSR
jgi:hypothetical protein